MSDVQTVRYLTFDQLSARFHGRSRPAINRDVKKGYLPKPITLGAINYWIESEVEAHMLAMREKQQSQTA